MRRRLLSSFAAVSLACGVFVAILWYRSYGAGESIQWRSTWWAGSDRRLARMVALLTRDGGLTLVFQHEERRIIHRPAVTRDERAPGRTTFHWDENHSMETAPEAGFFNRLGFRKRGERGTQAIGKSRLSTYGDYRYAMPFWFLALVLVLPAVYWIYRRTRQSGGSGATSAILENGESA